MRQFKSDGRYLHYNRGLHYIVEFLWFNERKLYLSLVKSFAQLYGPQYTEVLNTKYNYFSREMNTEYRVERNIKQKRCRIYMRDEGMLSMALLAMETV